GRPSSASRTVPPTTTSAPSGAEARAARSSATADRVNRSSLSSARMRERRQPEERERVVLEDLAADVVADGARPRPPALLVVVVGDQREVGAEQDAVLVLDQLGVR